jgi:hypothetical protein
MNAAPASCFARTKRIVPRACMASKSPVSGPPGTPKTYLTPSASKTSSSAFATDISVGAPRLRRAFSQNPLRLGSSPSAEGASALASSLAAAWATGTTMLDVVSGVSI